MSQTNTLEFYCHNLTLVPDKFHQLQTSFMVLELLQPKAVLSLFFSHVGHFCLGFCS